MRALILWLILLLPAAAQTGLYVNFSQSTVEGGSTVEGMVASNVPAPAEGIMVLLTAGDGATVPDRVFIEPGQKATRFPVDTSKVSRNRSVQVRAQVGPVVGVNLLHLMPVGEIAARTPPPDQLVTAGAQYVPNVYGDYGYGYGGYGYGYGYGTYCPPCPPSYQPPRDPNYHPENLPANWPGRSDGIPPDYPRGR